MSDLVNRIEGKLSEFFSEDEIREYKAHYIGIGLKGTFEAPEILIKDTRMVVYYILSAYHFEPIKDDHVSPREAGIQELARWIENYTDGNIKFENGKKLIMEWKDWIYGYTCGVFTNPPKWKPETYQRLSHHAYLQGYQKLPLFFEEYLQNISEER